MMVRLPKTPFTLFRIPVQPIVLTTQADENGAIGGNRSLYLSKQAGKCTIKVTMVSHAVCFRITPMLYLLWLPPHRGDQLAPAKWSPHLFITHDENRSFPDEGMGCTIKADRNARSFEPRRLPTNFHFSFLPPVRRLTKNGKRIVRDALGEKIRMLRARKPLRGLFPF